MNDMTPTSAERAEKLQGMGCKRKRVEDIRFRRMRTPASRKSTRPRPPQYLALWR